jgi:hypothetical protein
MTLPADPDDNACEGPATHARAPGRDSDRLSHPLPYRRPRSQSPRHHCARETAGAAERRSEIKPRNRCAGRARIACSDASLWRRRCEAVNCAVGRVEEIAHGARIKEQALRNRAPEPGIVAIECRLEGVEPAFAPVFLLLRRQPGPVAQAVEADDADQRGTAVGEAAVDSAVIGYPIARQAVGGFGPEQLRGFGDVAQRRRPFWQRDRSVTIETKFRRRCADAEMRREQRFASTMLERVRHRFGLQPQRLAGDSVYGAVRLLKWLLNRKITPHVPVWDRSALMGPSAEPTLSSTTSATSISAQAVQNSPAPATS